MIDPETQNELGRKIVGNLQSLPGYGAFHWWDHKGESPLDGATAQWGIDIKTVNKNDPNHRYDPSSKRNYPRVSESKNEIAASMNLHGILGLLVVLDYNTDTAEIYAKEMPLRPHWFNEAMKSGAYSWQKYNAPRLLENIPFVNPLKSHRSTTPHSS